MARDLLLWNVLEVWVPCLPSKLAMLMTASVGSKACPMLPMPIVSLCSLRGAARQINGAGERTLWHVSKGRFHSDDASVVFLGILRSQIHSELHRSTYPSDVLQAETRGLVCSHVQTVCTPDAMPVGEANLFNLTR